MGVENLLNQTVLIAQRTGNNDYGRPTYGSDTRCRARVQAFFAMVVTSTGQNATSHAKIYLPAGTVIQIGDKVTLPDGTELHALQVFPVHDNYQECYRMVLV